MRTAKPVVGLFDSGVGGLSVLRRMLDVPNPPWSRVHYLADLEHFPYGPRAATQVRALALSGIDLLAGLGAGLVAVACNTASSSGVRAGRPGTAVPILDIIGPGARELAALARREPARRVIILGTGGTVRSGVWEKALREEGFAGAVLGWPCPFLANLIEEGRNGQVARQAVREATWGLGEAVAGTAEGADMVVLGCTHYPFAKKTFEEVLTADVLEGPVRVIDPSGALAADIIAALRSEPADQEGLPGTAEEEEASEPGPVEVHFLTTGRAAHLRERAGQLLSDKTHMAGYRLLLDEIREVTLSDSTA